MSDRSVSMSLRSATSISAIDAISGTGIKVLSMRRNVRSILANYRLISPGGA